MLVSTASPASPKGGWVSTLGLKIMCLVGFAFWRVYADYLVRRKAKTS